MKRHSYRADPRVPAFPDDAPLLVFDGVCGLCNGWVDRVLRSTSDIRVCPAQSPLGTALLAHYGLLREGTDPFRSVLLLEDGVAHTRSDSVFPIFKRMGGAWPLLHVLKYFPRVFRDPVYDLVARNRYRVWGKREVCRVPTESECARFVS